MLAWLFIIFCIATTESEAAPTSQPFFGTNEPTTQPSYFAMSPDEFAKCEAANQVINFIVPDHTLLSAGILHETNRWRATEGLKPLLHHPQVDEACMIHVRDMVAKNYLAHQEKGTDTPQPIDRVRKAGLTPILAAENIATSPGIQYQSGRNVYPLKQWKRKGVSYEENGPAIPPHTYQSFAAQVVKQWIDSPSHRENIMLRDARYMGAACLPANPKSETDEAFHKFFCAQVFYTPSRFARERSQDGSREEKPVRNDPDADARARQPDAAPPEPPVPDPIGSDQPNNSDQPKGN